MDEPTPTTRAPARPREDTGGGWWRRLSGAGWGANASHGDSARLEAFSDGVLAIAITLLVLDVRVETAGSESLAAALHHAVPSLLAYAASFLQIGIMWANHHALFRVIERVDQLTLLANLLLLGFISFLPLPTRLVAEHHSGADGRTATLLYGLTLVGCAVAFNLLWHRALRRDLIAPHITPAFRRDVTVRYRIGAIGYGLATALCLVQPWLSVAVSAALALLFLLGPSTRDTVVPARRAAA